MDPCPRLACAVSLRSSGAFWARRDGALERVGGQLIRDVVPPSEDDEGRLLT